MVRSLLSRLFGSGGTSADRDDHTVEGSSDEPRTGDAGEGDAAEETARAAAEDTARNAAGDEATETATDGATDEATAEETNVVWDLIPSWEYDGKYVESGGQTRDEQEKALRDIQRQAAEIERSEAESDPQPDG